MRQLLEQVRDKKAQLALSFINAGEVYYVTFRKQGAARSKEILEDLRAMPIELFDAPENRILAAAEFKANYSLSYADAFAAALAQELNATLVTGDPEFRQLASIVQIMWLPQRP